MSQLGTGIDLKERSWLMGYATSWKVMGSSPDEVGVIFFN
jgi:hypothetical protein